MEKKRTSYNHRDGTRVTKDICLSLVFHGRKKRKKSKSDRREGREGERRRKSGKTKEREEENQRILQSLAHPSVLCFPGVITREQFPKILVTFSS